MRVTLTRRRLAGILLCVLALGILVGDGIARAAGWDGPVTAQFIGAMIAFIGAGLTAADATIARSNGHE
ncbi:hypothetical protein Lsed01_02397 [Demequina sediminis]|jgi:hypothetical protein|uniref:Uncharacterized protein n=1 Tax=Demequina sediminis TaxID=1930058 RepID=A0ABP9WJC5_9MICO|nr:hypothetical protein [Demequina sediminis]BDZ62150.1 hypothetical protein GCM10025873_19410 [Demequina sediminis]